ncbi:MAG: MarR family winged helix-turn-helix transcriptional regulator [Coprobacillaceae bacterium]
MSNNELHGQFIATIYDLKKLCTMMPTECQLQLSELIVMKSVVYGCNECLNVAEIQRIQNLSKPAISQTLNALERKGYIVRSIDSSDRRKIVVSATDEGNLIFSKTNDTYLRFLDDLITLYGEEDLYILIEKTQKLLAVYNDIMK